MHCNRCRSKICAVFVHMTSEAIGSPGAPGVNGWPADSLLESLRQDVFWEAQEFGLFDLALDDPMQPIIPAPSYPSAMDVTDVSTLTRGRDDHRTSLGTSKTPDSLRECDADANTLQQLEAYEDSIASPSGVSPYERWKPQERDRTSCVPGALQAFIHKRRWSPDRRNAYDEKKPIRMVPVAATGSSMQNPTSPIPEPETRSDTLDDVDTPPTQMLAASALDHHTGTVREPGLARCPKEGAGIGGRGPRCAKDLFNARRDAHELNTPPTNAQTVKGRSGFPTPGGVTYEFAGAIGCALSGRKRSFEDSCEGDGVRTRTSRKHRRRCAWRSGSPTGMAPGLSVRNVAGEETGDDLSNVPFPLPEQQWRAAMPQWPSCSSAVTLSPQSTFWDTQGQAGLVDAENVSGTDLFPVLNTVGNDMDESNAWAKRGPEALGHTAERRSAKKARQEKELCSDQATDNTGVVKHVPVPLSTTRSHRQEGVCMQEVSESKRRKIPTKVESAPQGQSKGLKYTSQMVRAAVQRRHRTTYGMVADELVAQLKEPMKMTEGSLQNSEGDNLRRRVYDVLNVFDAVGIIRKEDKEVSWQGLPASVEPLTNDLRAERAELRESVASKRECLSQLIEHYSALTAVVERNRDCPIDACPQDMKVLPLPFTIVRSRPVGVTDVQISPDFETVLMSFHEGPVEIYNDIWVLKRMGLFTRAGPDLSAQIGKLSQAPRPRAFASAISSSLIERIKGVFGERMLLCSESQHGQLSMPDSLDPIVRPRGRQQTSGSQDVPLELAPISNDTTSSQAPENTLDKEGIKLENALVTGQIRGGLDACTMHHTTKTPENTDRVSQLQL